MKREKYPTFIYTMPELSTPAANRIRWDALKLLDWEKDGAVIVAIMRAKQASIFEDATPQEVVDDMRNDFEMTGNEM